MKDYCGVVQDLWPLYLDGELSEESKQFVEEHIANCPNCQELNGTDIDLQGLLEIPPVNPGSAEGFLLKLKRRIRLTAVSLIVVALISVGGVWYLTDSQTSRAYREEMEHEKQFFQEQLVGLEQVSPPHDQLLNKLGLKFIVRDTVKSAGQIKIDYALEWEADSTVEWVTTERHWFSDYILVDAASGQPLQMVSGGGSSSARRFEGHIKANLGNQKVEKIVLKTRTLYAFAQPEHDISIKFDYAGGEDDVEVGEHFSYRGVDFVIDNLQLDSEEFKVNYRQLTPASEVGVYVLNFAFDDRLGNSWHTDPDADLVVANPKYFKMGAPQSPSKKWKVSVNHVVQVIPGIKSEVQLEGGEK